MHHKIGIRTEAFQARQQAAGAWQWQHLRLGQLRGPIVHASKERDRKRDRETERERWATHTNESELAETVTETGRHAN